MNYKSITILGGLSVIFGLLFMYLNNANSVSYQEEAYVLNISGHTYNLKNPLQRWDLPKELEEISGLSYYKKGQLACVQDEDGILYVYDLDKNEIIRKDEFGKKGDYEGVEIVQDTAYVLKSNGTVYFFEIKKNGIGIIEKIETDLRQKNDAEGFSFDEISQELLIACKEEPGTKKVDVEKSRSMYRIDLKEKKFKKKPKYILGGKTYAKKLEEKGLSKKKHYPFKPSGIAVHPQNNHIFIIASVGKMMVVLTPKGEIIELIPLDPKIFWQPEGICFSPDGDMYISSEGRGKKGYILKF